MGIYKRTQNTHTYEMALSMQSALAGKQITVNKVSSKRSVNKTVVQASNLSEKLSKAAVTAATTAALFASSAQAVTYDELQGLTYLQVKGTFWRTRARLSKAAPARR